MRSEPQVLIILGSKSDAGTMAGCSETLDKLEIPHVTEISSAHRNPEKTRRLASTAQEKGFKVIIAAAGMAAALPGVIASHSNLPVIGVPISSSALSGVDALYSIVQMPAGIPVAAVAIGDHGAKNAALLAARILAIGDMAIARRLKAYREALVKE